MLRRKNQSDRKGSTGRSKKRRWWGRKRDKSEETDESRSRSESRASTSSASSRKLSSSFQDLTEAGIENLHSGHRIVDLTTVFNHLEAALVCQNCKGPVKFTETQRRGLGASWQITCKSCTSMTKFPTTRVVGQRKNIYEVNRRAVLAMRYIGRGLRHLKVFNSIMDFPPPVADTTYKKIRTRIVKATKYVANESMRKAVEEEVKLNVDEKGESLGRDLTVSGDATWLTRGFKSLHGVSTVIGMDSGKVLDTEVLSKYCKACELWKEKKDTPEFEEWWEGHQHECSANFTGPSGGMEVQGMVEIYNRSKALHQIRYVNYLGDGDSKTFKAIENADPYKEDGIQVKKLECVGHIQKRMGSRLRKLKKECSKKKLSDGKPLGGKGRLTDTMIDLLSQYYGMAIRNNPSSPADMRRAVWAIYYHTISSDSKPQHQYCPKGKESWCKYQKAKALKQKGFQHKGSHLPVAVMEEVKPVFEDLSHIDLLKKCVGGRTQNANESFHNVVWSMCPKEAFCGQQVIEAAVYAAVSHFNDGASSRMEVMKQLAVEPGFFATIHAHEEDSERLKIAEIRAASATLESRRERRRKRKADEEKNRTDQYCAGLGS